MTLKQRNHNHGYMARLNKHRLYRQISFFAFFSHVFIKAGAKRSIVIAYSHALKHSFNLSKIKNVEH